MSMHDGTVGVLPNEWVETEPAWFTPLLPVKIPDPHPGSGRVCHGVISQVEFRERYFLRDRLIY